MSYKFLNLRVTHGIVLTMLFLQNVGAQSPRKDLIREQLLAHDWSTVSTAKLELENLQGEGISLVIALLENDQTIPLKNRAIPGYGDLNYSYRLDSPKLRAVWVIESIAFEDFGYHRESQIKEKKPAEWISNWWRRNREDWKRLDALSEAMRSSSSFRAWRAVVWLDKGQTTCDGLTSEFFDRSLRRQTQLLAESPTTLLSFRAKKLLRRRRDSDWTWLNRKNGSRKVLGDVLQGNEGTTTDLFDNSTKPTVQNKRASKSKSSVFPQLGKGVSDGVKRGSKDDM